MKLFCIIGALLFSLFSYWQKNDLDQYGTDLWQGWLLTYALTALVCFISIFKKLPSWLYGTGAILAFAHACLRFLAIQLERGIFFVSDNPAGNETGGLLIIALWLGILSLSQ